VSKILISKGEARSRSFQSNSRRELNSPIDNALDRESYFEHCWEGKGQGHA
jgi:hypothetical protein